jgi:hypothetical protein
VRYWIGRQHLEVSRHQEGTRVKPPFELWEPEVSTEELPSSPRPMMPLNRRRLRIGHPPQAIPVLDGDEEWSDEASGERARSLRQDLDPVFGYILAMALSVGLTPVQENTRYVLLWTFMALWAGWRFYWATTAQSDNR